MNSPTGIPTAPHASMRAQSFAPRLAPVLALLFAPVRVPMIALALALAACSDAGPLAPEPATTAESAYAVLASGSYETRAAVLLPSGETIYLVGVYFGARAGEPTYLAQVGVSAGSSSSLLMEQDSYRYARGTIEFAALLERGTLHTDGRVLDAVLRVNGQRVEVRLTRK